MKEELVGSIKERDMFGHGIGLNFDKQGDTHNTVIGGVFSIFIKFAVAVYVIMNFQKMLFYEQDFNSTQLGALDLADLGNVPLNETHSRIYFRLTKQLTETEVNPLLDETQRYLKVRMYFANNDYYAPAGTPERES
jgi:hypothetical protein